MSEVISMSKTPIEDILKPRPNIVALDTFIIRSLMLGERPDWHSTFVRARDNGFSFAVSCYSVLELMAQLKRGSIPEDSFNAGIAAADEFIEPKFPVTTDLKDLFWLAGLTSKVPGPPSPKELSLNLWRALHPGDDRHAMLNNDIEGELELSRKNHQQTIGGLQQQFAGTSIDFEKTIAILRDVLVEALDVTPEGIERLNVVTTLSSHFAESALQSKSPYNPASKKRKNDGIDRWLPYVLVLPAFLITESVWVNIAQQKADAPWKDRMLTLEQFVAQYDGGTLPDLWS